MRKLKAILLLFELGVTIAILIFFMFFSKDRTYLRKIRKIWAKIEIFLMGVKLKICGKRDKEAKLIVLNHQSMLDIIVLEAIFDGDPAWIAKQEIGNIPFYGLLVKLPKMILIDRKDKRAIVKMLKKVKEALKEDREIFIFPEGTRGKGDKLLKFKSGAKVLAEKLNLKVQPIILIGTRDVFDSIDLKAKSGEVIVKYLDSIEPKDENWYEKLEEIMNKEYDRLKEGKEC